VFLREVYVKTVLTLSILLLSSVSFAGGKMRVYFLASKCSSHVTSEKGNVYQICFGKRTDDTETEYFAVTYKPKSEAAPPYPQSLYPVLEWQPGNSGITGKTKTVQLYVLVEGDIQHRMDGMGDETNLTSLGGKLPDGQDFNVTGFQPVKNANAY
jgi:hypothetical protein